MGRLSKDRRDIYYRNAKREGYRARSSYKLLQLNNFYRFIDYGMGVRTVVDLCAAPGSWSQVVYELLCRTKRDFMRMQNREDNISFDDILIIAVDLQEIAPLPGVTVVKGDITDISTVNNILQLCSNPRATSNPSSSQVLEPAFVETANVIELPYKAEQQQVCFERPDLLQKNLGVMEPVVASDDKNDTNCLVDVVLCDGAPDVTGLHDLDLYIQNDLIIASLGLSTKILKEGGTMVCKIFRGENINNILLYLLQFFQNVHCAKPASSRGNSPEAFAVCTGFIEGSRYTFEPFEPVISGDSSIATKATIPFVACGSLEGFDSNATYPVPLEHFFQSPVQLPILPKYVLD